MSVTTALTAHRVLSALYPDARTELTYDGPFQLLIAVVLSAQCTDARVNMTTPALFDQFPDVRAMAKAPLPALESMIHSCGFYTVKAHAIKCLSQELLIRFNGEVPDRLEDLVTLPGVGRKTASVVLSQAFGIPAIAVDTHVSRVAQRLGWTKSVTPTAIEMDLRKLFPTTKWASVNGLLILHGRRTCKARRPLCQGCKINTFCNYYLNEHERRSAF